MKHQVHRLAYIGMEETFLRYLKGNGKSHLINEVKNISAECDEGNSEWIAQELFLERNARIIKLIDDPLLGFTIFPFFRKFSESPFYQSLNRIRELAALRDEKVDSPNIARIIHYYITAANKELKIELKINTNTTSFRLSPRSPFVCSQQMDSIMLGINNVFRNQSGENLLKLKVKHSELEGTQSVYKKLFKVMPYYDANHYELVFSNSFQDDHSNKSNQVIFDLARRLEKDLAFHSYRYPLSQRCKELIKIILPLGEPTREQMCNIFHVSLSSFKRNLSEEGYSYSELLREVRMELVENYLLDENLSFSDISSYLGYKDLPQFSKAFKKWYGISPTAYKKSA